MGDVKAGSVAVAEGGLFAPWQKPRRCAASLPAPYLRRAQDRECYAGELEMNKSNYTLRARGLGGRDCVSPLSINSKLNYERLTSLVIGYNAGCAPVGRGRQARWCQNLLRWDRSVDPQKKNESLLSI